MDGPSLRHAASEWDADDGGTEFHEAEEVFEGAFDWDAASPSAALAGGRDDFPWSASTGASSSEGIVDDGDGDGNGDGDDESEGDEMEWELNAQVPLADRLAMLQEGAGEEAAAREGQRNGTLEAILAEGDTQAGHEEGVEAGEGHVVLCRRPSAEVDDTDARMKPAFAVTSGSVLEADPFSILVALLMGCPGLLPAQQALRAVSAAYAVAVTQAVIASARLAVRKGLREGGEGGPNGAPHGEQRSSWPEGRRIVARQVAVVAEAACLPFLRRAGILVAMLHPRHETSTSGTGPGSSSQAAAPHLDPWSFQSLRGWLQLPSVAAVIAAVIAPSAPDQAPMLSWWSKAPQGTGAASGLETKMVLVKAPKRPQLAPLPRMYQDLLLETVGQTCESCGTEPVEPAICLICGKLLCCSSPCCQRYRVGECYWHALQENGGVGLYLLMKSTDLLIIRDGRVCSAPSIYLDAHGEEDLMMRRGRPLYMNDQRMSELRRQWVNVAFDHNSQLLRSSHLGAMSL